MNKNKAKRSERVTHGWTKATHKAARRYFQEKHKVRKELKQLCGQ